MRPNSEALTCRSAIPQDSGITYNGRSPLTTSLAKFSRVCGIPIYTLRQMAEDGTLPCVRTGKRGIIRVLTIPALRLLGGIVEGNE
jgi:hypothetical protein